MPKFVVAFLFFSTAAFAQSNSLLGNWSEPTGSTIEVYTCSSNLCLRLSGISPQAPASTDIHNPDASLRNRPLCGLVIGKGFHPNEDRAEDGELYDPKSGKTYHGTISRDGDKLALRGYVGIKLFGRTEIWTRATANFKSCSH